MFTIMLLDNVDMYNFEQLVVIAIVTVVAFRKASVVLWM